MKGYFTHTYHNCALAHRFDAVVATISNLVFVFAALILSAVSQVCAETKVWQCSQGYTNNPHGKTNCQPAGGIETCGSDGSRYLSPRRIGENPIETSCKVVPKGKSSRVDMSSAKGAQFGETRSFERLSAPPQSRGVSFPALPKMPKMPQMPSFSPSTLGKPELSDVFSCYSGNGEDGGCSIEDLQRFIEGTFLKISDVLNR